MQVGVISELWRFPVKSMRGDRVVSTEVTERWGFPGDRGWALRDEETGRITNAKKLTSLLQFHARYLAEPVGAGAPPVEITVPGGRTVRSDDDDNGVDAALSAAAGRRVTLWPRQSPGNHAHHRRGRLSEAERSDTYFDAMPLSLATTTALGSVQGTVPGSSIDPRRFRKNIIVSTDGGPGRFPESDPGGFPEFDWVGRRLMLGEVVCEVTVRIPRCVMVSLPQAELPHDGAVLKALAARTGMDFGVYLRVVEPGRISEGDPVHLA
ncbi:molybdenum cofactor sulfurase [Dietzia sp. NCCP-2495]|uniref:MOSC domain-containing protein n=1 Tax=Dietzia sp. NCCP-2495 TaxID=2934675 RepID=UPI002232BF1A|nr:MOSC N-terminal beta barrel domain-containing protein [Dietzia sp. NCCP-2495]GLB63573.1 molybdenum cofactor sulfurase [Dietzia sp. NCCP-2495]